MGRHYRERGVEKIGIGHMFEVLRWEYHRRTKGDKDDFKLNNNYRSRYARLIVQLHPDIGEMLELRELKAP